MLQLPSNSTVCNLTYSPTNPMKQISKSPSYWLGN